MTGSSDVKLTKDTYIPIGVAGTLFAALLGGGMWLNSVVLKLELSNQLIRHQIEDINEKLDQSLQDRWTATDMRHWTDLLKAENGEVVVPDPVPSWRKK